MSEYPIDTPAADAEPSAAAPLDAEQPASMTTEGAEPLQEAAPAAPAESPGAIERVPSPFESAPSQPAVPAEPDSGEPAGPVPPQTIPTPGAFLTGAQPAATEGNTVQVGEQPQTLASQPAVEQPGPAFQSPAVDPPNPYQLLHAGSGEFAPLTDEDEGVLRFDTRDDGRVVVQGFPRRFRANAEFLGSQPDAMAVNGDLVHIRAANGSASYRITARERVGNVLHHILERVGEVIAP